MNILDVFRFILPITFFACGVAFFLSPLILRRFRTDNGKVGPKGFTLLFSKKEFLNEQGILIRERLRLIINWSFLISLLSFLVIIYEQYVVFV
ncbi:hypothetical protein JS86_13550 [Vibrio vulnificus]|nr:hypothetical protein JS86_13550 [Vibrio vulnificus]